jgi:hypothetical protein
MKRLALLARILRSDAQLTRATRDYWADIIETKRDAGRPKKGNITVGRLALAVSYFECYRARFQKRYGRKHTVTLKNGRTYNLRQEAIRRAVKLHKIRWGDFFGEVTAKQIDEQLRRPKNRRH